MSPHIWLVRLISTAAVVGLLEFVTETQSWDNIPPNLKVDVQNAAGNTPGYYLVEIREVLAPAMKLKGVRISGTNCNATLGDIVPLP